MNSKFIAIISLLLLTSTLSIQVSTLGNEKPPVVTSCCLNIPRCAFYQVNTDLTGYGCARCNDRFVLSAEDNGTGICLTTRSNISNCIYVIDLISATGSPICGECNQGYILNATGTTCTKLTDATLAVTGCFSYVTDATAGVICGFCKAGRTLVFAADGTTSCETGLCTIDRCSSCIEIGTTVFCQVCKNGTIGVLASEVTAATGPFYTECLRCNDWREALLSPVVTGM
jgi:hypothetical protein